MGACNTGLRCKSRSENHNTLIEYTIAFFDQHFIGYTNKAVNPFCRDCYLKQSASHLQLPMVAKCTSNSKVCLRCIQNLVLQCPYPDHVTLRKITFKLDKPHGLVHIHLLFIVQFTKRILFLAGVYYRMNHHTCMCLRTFEVHAKHLTMHTRAIQTSGSSSTCKHTVGLPMV